MPEPNVPHPGRFLRQKLEEKGWTQEELATITGRNRQTISGIASGRTGVTPEMALALGAAFGNDAAEWLRWSAEYDLATSESNTEPVERRARLYHLAPIREMQKRGWLPEISDLDEMEREVYAFFGCSIGESLEFPVAARRSIELPDLNAAERAWCFRARQLAALLPTTGAFSPGRLPAVEARLRELAAFPKEARKLSRVLAEAGIRFVVIELLPGAEIDGAAFWLDETKPVIAVSIRWDRIDAFWFTVLHEFSHIKHGDQLSIDTDLLREESNGITVVLAEDEAERRASAAAANTLIPDAELDSFIRRLAPYYSADRIVQFAHKVRIHPGIIVGQLQHRKQVGYSALRDFLVKIRSVVVETSLTDGWGQSISPGLF
jgi:HTH-type transcriptional regulator / antitoxin HigA